MVKACYYELILKLQIILGANFYIHANNYTLKFFEAVVEKLAHWYTPDMGIMIHQCHTWNRPKCTYIPHKYFYH